MNPWATRYQFVLFRGWRRSDVTPAMQMFRTFQVAQLVGDARGVGSTPGQEDPWRSKWQHTPVFLPGKFHKEKSMVAHSPWGRKGLNKTEPKTT